MTEPYTEGEDRGESVVAGGEGKYELAAQRPVHSAKQEITEPIKKFLDWLWQTHNRTAAPCTLHPAPSRTRIARAAIWIVDNYVESQSSVTEEAGEFKEMDLTPDC